MFISIWTMIFVPFLWYKYSILIKNWQHCNPGTTYNNRDHNLATLEVQNISHKLNNLSRLHSHFGCCNVRWSFVITQSRLKLFPFALMRKLEAVSSYVSVRNKPRAVTVGHISFLTKLNFRRRSCKSVRNSDKRLYCSRLVTSAIISFKSRTTNYYLQYYLFI